MSEDTHYLNIIKQFFIPTREKEQRSLVGRIHAKLQKDAHAMLLQLQLLKETLRKELDQEETGLWSSFEAVINPLLREYRLIERQLIRPGEGDAEHQTRLSNANQWIDRAKLWVSLCSKPADRQSMIEAVVGHTLQLQDQRIDRDLKTLLDYKEHEIQLLGLGEEAMAVVRNHLDQELTPFLQGLSLLKQERPKEIALASLMAWKSHADEERTQLFDLALQKIDAIVNRANPAASHDEEQEHLKELIHQINHLENEVQFLEIQLDRALLDHFEEQVQQLHHDLRLTPELVERIQDLLKQLTHLRRKIN